MSLSKTSQVEGPSWSTIPIVSVVWRVLNNRRRLLHTIACRLTSGVLGRGPTELGTVRGNSCQASSVERARYSAAMSRCWGLEQTKVSAKYCQCLALKTNKYCNHIGWEISQKDADSNGKATIEDQKSKSKESSTWCLHSILALSKNPRDLAIPFLCEANLATFCCHASSLSSHACWGAGRGGSPELRDASTGDWFGNTTKSVKCLIGGQEIYIKWLDLYVLAW